MRVCYAIKCRTHWICLSLYASQTVPSARPLALYLVHNDVTTVVCMHARMPPACLFLFIVRNPACCMLRLSCGLCVSMDKADCGEEVTSNCWLGLSSQPV